MRRWIGRLAVVFLVIAGVLFVGFHHAPVARALPGSPLTDSSAGVQVPMGFAGFFVMAGLLFAAFALMQRRSQRRG